MHVFFSYNLVVFIARLDAMIAGTTFARVDAGTRGTITAHRVAQVAALDVAACGAHLHLARVAHLDDAARQAEGAGTQLANTRTAALVALHESAAVAQLANPFRTVPADADVERHRRLRERAQ